MGIVLMRLVYLLYFLGIALVMYRAISHILFSRKNWKKKIVLFFGSICFAIVWPFAIFSPPGRKKLGEFFNFN